MNYDCLVLSGAGSKGYLQLGCVQALIDKGYMKEIKYFYGTSCGAIISYLLILSYSPTEILLALHTNQWLENMKYFDLLKLSQGDGACSFSHIHEGLEKLTLEKIEKLITLKELKEKYDKTLVCVTYNMTKCMIEYVSHENYPDLDCLSALRMSCNIPLIFDRFCYNECYYIDGGIADNFPLLKAQEEHKKIIGVYIDVDNNSLQDDPEKGIITYFLKLLYIPIIQSTRRTISMCNESTLLIPIKTNNLKNAIEFSVSTTEKLDMFSNGYESVKKVM